MNFQLIICFFIYLMRQDSTYQGAMEMLILVFIMIIKLLKLKLQCLKKKHSLLQQLIRERSGHLEGMMLTIKYNYQVVNIMIWIKTNGIIHLMIMLKAQLNLNYIKKDHSVVLVYLMKISYLYLEGIIEVKGL